MLNSFMWENNTNRDKFEMIIGISPVLVHIVLVGKSAL